MWIFSPKYDFTDYFNRFKMVRLIKCLDTCISKNFKTANVELRFTPSNGLWCCVLLPTILVLYSLQYKVSLLYSTISCTAVGLLFYCLLYIVFLSVSCSVLYETIHGGCFTATLVLAMLLYGLLEYGLLFSLTYSVAVTYSFNYFLKLCLVQCPKTFTIGEAMVVVQGFTLTVIALLFKMFYNIGDQSDTEMEFVNAVNVTMLSSVGIIVTALILWDDIQSLKILYYITGIVGTFALLLLHVLVGIDCIIQIASYILLDLEKVKLCIFWFSLSVMAGLVLLFRTQLAVRATTIARKVFHIFASLVFLTGIICDVYLITLAAGFGLSVVILAEALRKSNIKDVSEPLEAAFQVYKDEKDDGYFAMTAIYLYVGLACPLVLVPKYDNNELELLSGVLSIGIGDTAASWFGAQYGFNKWAGGAQKTLEGTLFNILSQIATVYALEFFGILLLPNSMLRTIFAAVVSGLVEAKTDQIDNLILPLITLLSFQATLKLGSI